MAATAMHLTDEVTLYPNASISGRNGTVVDTAIDVHWPGPGRVYLHPREVAEAVRVAHVLVEVSDVLKAVGWVHSAEHNAIVSDLEAKTHIAVSRAAELEEKLEAALKTIQLVSPAPAEITDRGVPAVEAPEKPGVFSEVAAIVDEARRDIETAKKPAAKKPARKKDTDG